MKLLLALALWLPLSAPVDDPAPPAIDRATIEALVAEFTDKALIEVKVAGSLAMQGTLSVEFVEKDGQELVLLEQTLEGKMVALGEESTISSETRSWYLLSGRGELHSGEMRETEDGATRNSKIVKTETGYRRTLEVFGEEGSEELGPIDDSLEGYLQATRWLSEPRQEGDSITIPSVSWTQLDLPTSESIYYLGPASFEFRGKTIAGHRLRTISDGMIFEGVHWPSGEMFSAKGAGGLIEIQMVEQFSSFDDANRPDLATTLKLSIDVPLGDPYRLEELVLEAPPSARGVFTNGPRQKVVESERGVTISISSDAEESKPSALDEKERAKWTEPKPEYALDAVRARAKEIVGEEIHPVEQAVLLSNWVEETLEYTAAQNAVSALEVLKNESGDCSEYSLLFVALARSLGIPAREVSGYVWAEDEEFGSGFFGHAWAEIYDGKGWWSVDPTWGQLGVDAGHLVVEPAKDYQLLELMGSGTFEFSLIRLSRAKAWDEEE